MSITTETTLKVDKYLVSPLTRLTETGHYAASVSIRSGMHDRVLRLPARFATHEAARRYAMQQGVGWLRQLGVPHQHASLQQHEEHDWPRKN